MANQIIKSALALLAAISTTACGGSLYQVGDSSTEGIPFYEVEHHAVTTTTYRQSFYTFTLTYRFLDVTGDKVLHQGEVTLYTSDKACTQKALNAFLSESDGFKAAAAFKAEADACKVPFSPLKPTALDQGKVATLPVYGVKTEWRKRAGAKKHINVRKSAMGTTSANITLSENGYLTGAQASSENKAIETALSTAVEVAGLALGQIPINELLTDRWGLKPEDEDKAQELFPAAKADPKQFRATLTFSEGGRLYSVESDAKGTTAFSIAELGGTAPKQKDENAVEFSGSVKLPKK